jgi:hypothetical protein
MTQKFYRKVLRITAEDSPNVRLARAEIAAGLPVSNRVVIPGVLPWDEYQKRLALWDDVRQSIGLKAQFWEGASVLLYPTLWLNRAENQALAAACHLRPAEAIGVDTAEGGDSTALAAINRWGLKELISMKTPDTSVIPNFTLAFMRKHGVPPEAVMFDNGGGGKQHADALRSRGYDVRGVSFGEPISMEMRRGVKLFSERVDTQQEKFVYRNRRAQMYGLIREAIDPARDAVALGLHVGGANPEGFSIPAEYANLRRELAPIPLLYDAEGRLFLPPKHPPPGADEQKRRNTITLVKLIGHSPDEADALAIALYCLLHKRHQATAEVG